MASSMALLEAMIRRDRLVLVAGMLLSPGARHVPYLESSRRLSDS